MTPEREFVELWKQAYTKATATLGRKLLPLIAAEIKSCKNATGFTFEYENFYTYNATVTNPVSFPTESQAVQFAEDAEKTMKHFGYKVDAHVLKESQADFLPKFEAWVSRKGKDYSFNVVFKINFDLINPYIKINNVRSEYKDAEIMKHFGKSGIIKIPPQTHFLNTGLEVAKILVKKGVELSLGNVEDILKQEFRPFTSKNQKVFDQIRNRYKII